jgi:hypothetical protein
VGVGVGAAGRRFRWACKQQRAGKEENMDDLQLLVSDMHPLVGCLREDVRMGSHFSLQIPVFIDAIRLSYDTKKHSNDRY